MPLTLQAHLLRVLTDQNFYRIGGTQAVRANVRFIAATNRDLQQAVHKGSFREDLFYRLAVISITLPPLRERLDDLPALVKHFLGRTAKPGTQQHCSLSEPALKMLQQYSWPGNIRELENVLTRAIILCPTKTIEPEHLSLSPILQKTGQAHNGASTPVRYHDAIEAHSRMLIEEALRRNGWNQTKTADELGLQRTYLTKLLRQKNISGRPPKGPDPEGDTGHTG
jgi:DNA-binding NtrC family response regulator